MKDINRRNWFCLDPVVLKDPVSLSLPGHDPRTGHVLDRVLEPFPQVTEQLDQEFQLDQVA